MRRDILFLILFITSIFGGFTTLASKEISGTLSKGEGSSFTPIQGSAFSITRDLLKGVYGGSYNVTIKNSSRVFYSEKDQSDDIYLIFNEPVDYGDLIEIYVNDGIFNFKMSRLEKLPDAVIDALKEQVPKQYEKMHNLHKDREDSVKKTATKERELESSVKEIEKIDTQDSLKKEDIESDIPDLESKKEIGFFESLSKKIDSLFQESDKVDNRPKSSTPLDVSTFDSSSFPVEKIENIGSSNSIDDTDIKSRQIQEPKIDTPLNISTKIDNIEAVNRIDTAKVPNVKEPSLSSLPKTTFKQSDHKPVIESKEIVTDKVVNPKELQTTNSVPPVVGKFQTKIDTTPQKVPTFQDSSGYKVKRLDPVEPKPVKVVEEEELVEIVKVPPLKESDRVQKPIIERDRDINKIIITKTITPDASKEEPRVIKRHIDPDEYRKSQSANIDRMSDRVLGGGYADKPKGTIKVRAYSNEKAVSAWVEVFKAGTNQRVTTFYTGQGKSLKDIKLPAGVYVIKATYRTASSKQKKSLGKVVLKDGGTIKRDIHFNDSKVTISVKKGKEPLYAKVEVFKSSSKRRVTYAFTSRKSGKIELNLAQGEYDIIVRNHDDKKEFHNVLIFGDESKVINVKF